jgi:hypothetical protein
MMKETLDYLDYLKAAFYWKVRLGGLGYLPMNILILIGFGILGIGNPGFWLKPSFSKTGPGHFAGTE